MSGADPRLDQLDARVASLTGALRTATALANSGRTLDLDGLDTEVGRLCAAALDLPPELWAASAVTLAALAREVETLFAVLTAHCTRADGEAGE